MSYGLGHAPDKGLAEHRPRESRIEAGPIPDMRTKVAKKGLESDSGRAPGTLQHRDPFAILSGLQLLYSRHRYILLLIYRSGDLEMGWLSKRCAIVAVFSIIVVLALAVGLPVNSTAETETSTILPGMYLALLFDLNEGNELQFEITSTVAVYVGVLDTTNYNSYSTSGDFSSTLFVTSSASTEIQGDIEAPSDGRYYLIVENTASSSSAFVTIEYDIKGDGTLSGLAGAVIMGGIAGAIGAAIGGAIVYRRRKARSATVPPDHPTEGSGEMPPSPPVKPQA